MDNRLPYYMAYPMPLQYDDERIERRDFEYMKSLYPGMARKILPYVEEECDRMEYEGSMIYDEYPDQLQLQLMCRRIYDKVKDLSPDDIGDAYLPGDYEGNGAIPAGWKDEMEAQYYRPFPTPKRRKENLVHDLIHVMLYQELFKRRCDRRRCRRKFY
ncbi:MAG TPA: hypothetical protein DCZ20_01335 [Lachnospiraceae bacterium]|nr:hypothetical protein [Lachnospiraceae bacterium]